MFKGIATLVMVLMGISSAYADMTGYDWLKTSTNLKSVYLSGYMHGFKFGETIGVAKGVSNTFVRFKELSDSMKENNDKKILKVAKEFESCSEAISKNSTMLLSTALLPSKEPLKDDITYYVDEIDSFLQAYPLCKGKDIGTVVIPNLVMVWFKSSKETFSYSDAGAVCSK